MEFNLSTDLSTPPEAVWPVLLDVRRIAACIPGCEQVEELAALAQYKAVMKQKLGPFRLEVPAEIFVDEVMPPQCVRAHATGRDKYTGTTFTVSLSVVLAPAAPGGSTLTVDAGLKVAGRLASLGYSVIRKRAEENFAEFNQRLNAEIVA
jgi:carbon monoxide dehydrogenase subunit G